MLSLDNALSAEELVSKIIEWMDDTVYLDDRDPRGVEGLKPHGRRCWTLHLKAWVGAYIDLSVMPRTAPSKGKES